MTISGPDLTADLHTHSDLTDGADSPEAMAAGAGRAGLSVWGLSDHVRASTDWLPDYVPRVRALRVDGLQVRCGVEAKILDISGRLDMPPGAFDLDYILVADHQFPGHDGPVDPREVRAWVGDGQRSATELVDDLVAATVRAVETNPFPTILAHLFSVLPKCGLDESEVTDEHLRSLGAALARHDAAVEANEKWRCPSWRVLESLAGMGVRLTAGSDAHRVEDIGQWDYADHTATVSAGSRA